MTPVTNIENLHETIFVKLYNNNLFYLAELTIFKDSLRSLLTHAYYLTVCCKKKSYYPLHQDLNGVLLHHYKLWYVRQQV